MCGYQIITTLQEHSETPLNIQSNLLFRIVRLIKTSISHSVNLTMLLKEKNKANKRKWVKLRILHLREHQVTYT